jgi:kinetochore protein Mis13/DSN1
MKLGKSSLLILNRKNKLIGSSQQSPSQHSSDWEQDDGFKFTRSQSSQDPKNNKQLTTPEQQLREEMNALAQNDVSPKFDFPLKKKQKQSSSKTSQTKGQKQRVRTSNILDDLDHMDIGGTLSQSPDETLPLNDEDSSSRPKNNHRRSSYHKRGKRMLSIVGFQGVPHEDVPVNDYYKFLGNTPPPDRMRQLLIWCFEKSLETRTRSKSNQSEPQKIAKVVLNEIIDELREKKFSTSWYGSEDNEVFKNVKTLANPMNENNKRAISTYQEKLKELESQKKEWEQSYNRMVKPVRSLPSVNISNDKLDEYVNDKPNYKSIVDNSLLERIDNTQKHLQHKTDTELPNSIDIIYHSAYKMDKLVQLAETVQCEQLKPKVTSLVKDFMTNTSQVKQTHGYGNSRDILRCITRLECTPEKIVNPTI